MGTVEAPNIQVNSRTGTVMLKLQRIRAVELPGEAEQKTSETWGLSEINKTNIRLY